MNQDGLVRDYTFEGNLSDSSGNHAGGIMSGETQFAAGRNGACLKCTGRNWMDTGLLQKELGDSFTVECWVNPSESQTPWAGIFGDRSGNDIGFCCMQFGTYDHVITALIGTGKGDEPWWKPEPFRLACNRWQHIALVKTPRECRLYHNGVLASIGEAMHPLESSNDTVTIGSGGRHTHPFTGLIDDLRIWSRALDNFDHAGIGQGEAREVTIAALSLNIGYGESLDENQPSVFEVSLDEYGLRSLPKDLTEVVVAVEEQWCEFQGVKKEKSLLPPLTLKRGEGFTHGQFALSGQRPGLYFLTFTPVSDVAGKAVMGNGRTCSYVVPGESAPHAVVPPVEAVSIPGMAFTTKVITLNGNDWRIAVDPANRGCEEKWFESPRKDSRPTKVPWVIQDVFPGYQGVAWYWREFDVPSNPCPDGRYLLRFHAVDYLADVWVNGHHIGRHEGGETPFVLDMTEVARVEGKNMLAVRVLNPTNEPIDGITLKQTASSLKQYPMQSNTVYNVGGIVDSVEMIAAPPLWIENMHVFADWKTGEIRLRLNVCNFTGSAIDGVLRFSVAPAVGGRACGGGFLPLVFAPGHTLVDSSLKVDSHRLWQLEEPYLYRVTAQIQEGNGSALDEQSVRCGFRDFRFESGYFRLNGRRIFLNGGLYIHSYPVGHVCPPTEDMLRRDVLNMKTLGFNFCRIAFGGSRARQMDIFDETGILVCMGHYANWQLRNSTQMVPRFDRSLCEMVRRDRNHPCVVGWEFLNETSEGPVFRHAVDALRVVRALDASRMCFLNSGRFDNDHRVGSASNPDSASWDIRLCDVHAYPIAPHADDVQTTLRSRKVWREDPEGTGPVFVSEYGQCGTIDVPRVLRLFEQMGRGDSDDACWHREMLGKFMDDWTEWKLDRVWARAEDFFAEAHLVMSKLRLLGENAVRANPFLVGLSTTFNIADMGCLGSGAANLFRELKPGMTDAVSDLNSPLRWCLFVNPVNIYKGSKVRLEAVLFNQDALPEGAYKAHLQVVGPEVSRLWERTITIEIPPSGNGAEPPYAAVVFADEVFIDGPSGKYRFLASFERGAAATGGETEFYVADPSEMPEVVAEVVLYDDDAALESWLRQHGIRVRKWPDMSQDGRHVVLVSTTNPVLEGNKVDDIIRRVAGGDKAIFLDPRVFSDGENDLRWSPLKQKGQLGDLNWGGAGGYFRAVQWAKHHPIFDGLPCGGLLDPVFYREILPHHAFLRCDQVVNGNLIVESVGGLDTPDEAVCGANRMSSNYGSGIHMAVYRHGSGRFILNNLKIRENLGKDPVAERLLRNMINYLGTCK